MKTDFKSWISHRFRLTLVNADTHERLQSVEFNRGKAIGVLAGAFLILLCSMYAVLVFTPLRRTIPGYPDQKFRARAVENAILVDSLQNALVRWELYSENLRRVLSGEQTLSLESVAGPARTAYLEAKSEEYNRVQDSLLRAQVKKEERFGVSSSNKTDMPIDGIHFFTPVKGVVSQGYDRVLHPYIDIAATANSVIKSTLDGTVIFAGWSEESGYTIQIQHSGDIVSAYKHCQRLLKKVGDKVQAGTPIAHVGNTGSTSHGYHLHFELWYRGAAVDPRNYIVF